MLLLLFLVPSLLPSPSILPTAASASDLIGQSDKYDALRYDLPTPPSNKTSDVTATSKNGNNDVTAVPVEEEEFADFAAFSGDGESKLESLETVPKNVEDFGDFGEVLSSSVKTVEKVEKREKPDDKYTALKELISNKTLFTSAPPAPLSLDDPLPLAETRDKDSNPPESNSYSSNALASVCKSSRLSVKICFARL